MLDQNTDRMWYVIGAVIVGAAIIFLANGTLPSIFASVTDSFEDVSNQGVDTIASIGTEHTLMDTINNPSTWEQGIINSDTGMNSEAGNTVYYLRTQHHELPAGTYRITGTTVTEYVPRFFIFYYDMDGSFRTRQPISRSGTFNVRENELIRIRYTELAIEYPEAIAEFSRRVPSQVGTDYNFSLERVE